MAERRVPFRIADILSRVQNSPGYWRNVGRLLDRNFEEVGKVLDAHDASITALEAGGGFPEFTVARKTADQSTTSASLVDITDLTFSIVASGIYTVEASLFVVSGSTSVAVGVALNGPASPTAVNYAAYQAANTQALNSGGATAYDTVLTPTATPSTSVPHMHFLSGLIRNGANAGTLALRMNTASAGTSVTVKAGSWARLTRIA